MKKIFKVMSMVLTVMLVFSLVTPVFAQDTDEPEEDPIVIVVSSKFLNHPVVKMLSSFFSFLFEAPETEEPVEDTEGEPGEDENGEDETPEDENEVEVPEEVVASLHEEEKLGFGVITKLLAILAESKLTCVETGEFCDLTLEMLVEEYNAGASIGEMFAKYGKPDMTGVGQVRKAVEPKVKTNSGKKK